MRRVLSIVFIIITVAALGYGLLTCYGNFFQKTEGSSGSSFEMPKIEQATHSFKTTAGTLYLASKFDKYGDSSAVYILHGFWQLEGTKFVYHAGELALDEKIWGKITVELRRK